MSSVLLPLASGQASHAAGKRHLVEFRAGRLRREGNALVPDDRKGTVYLDVADDELLHFYWQDRTTGVDELDLIIFPEEAELLKIEQVQGRVMVLKFNSSSQKHFFWMQEPTEENDEQLRQQVNATINNPPQAQPEPPVQALPGPIAGSSATGAMSAEDQAKMDRIRSIIAGIQIPQGERTDIDLADILTPDNVRGVLGDPAAREAMFPHLPDGAAHTQGELADVVRSPQFRQSLNTLTYALRSGHLGPLLASLGLDTSSVQGNAVGVKAFLQAVAKHVAQQKRGSDGGDAMDTSQ
ncbi:hypothetical protein RI367_006696 [Sorochytrium milnesiophthora]